MLERREIGRDVLEYWSNLPASHYRIQRPRSAVQIGATSAEGKLVGACDVHAVARLIAVLPLERVVVVSLIVEVVDLRLLARIYVGEQEVEAFAEGSLSLDLQLVIPLAGAAIADRVQRAILRIRHQQRGQRNRRLVIIRTVNDGRVQVVIEGIGDLHAQGRDVARKLLEYARVDRVQLLNVMLVAAIEKVGERTYEPGGQLPFDADVEPVVIGLREVLRIPQQILPTAADICVQSFARYRTEIRKQWIAGREGICQSCLRHAVRQWSYTLVTRHAKERRLQKIDVFEARDRSRGEVILRWNHVAGIAEAQRSLIVHPKGETRARRQRQLGRIPHAGMTAVGKLPGARQVVKAAAPDQLRSLGRKLRWIGLYF